MPLAGNTLQSTHTHATRWQYLAVHSHLCHSLAIPCSPLTPMPPPPAAASLRSRRPLTQRWSGDFQASATGPCSFQLHSDDVRRLRLDRSYAHPPCPCRPLPLSCRSPRGGGLVLLQRGLMFAPSLPCMRLPLTSCPLPAMLPPPSVPSATSQEPRRRTIAPRPRRVPASTSTTPSLSLAAATSRPPASST